MTALNGTVSSTDAEVQEHPQHFTNEVIEQLPLPSLAQLSKIPVSTSYAKANRYIRLTTTLIVVLILSIVWWVAPLQNFISISANFRNSLVYFIFGAAIIGMLLTFYGTVADKRKFYALREHDISFTSGVIFINMVSQPVLRIQHVELRRGPIDRKLGLANLQVFSAGGALHTFEIPGLPIVEAQKIRQFILEHKGTNRNG